MSDTTTESSSGAACPQTPILRTLAIATGLTAIIALVVFAFSWPAVPAEPKAISIAVSGPEAAVSAIETRLTEEGDGVFDTTVVEDRDEAVEGIEERDYFGAIILGTEPELLTASANGAVNGVVAELDTRLQTALTAQTQAAAEASGQAAPDVTLTVTDIAPYSEDDPNGSLLSSAFFPMLIGGMIGGILISTLIVGSTSRILAVTVYSAVGGLVLAGILQGWFGSILGEFWLNVGAFSMAIAAIAAPMIGFVALIGRAGTAVGPVVMMLFANPISGAALPPQFLPGSWGEIGQWLPPGASATLVRELSYFPNADMTFPWLVLTGWVVGGLILALVGHSRTAVTDNLHHRRTKLVKVTPEGQQALDYMGRRQARWANRIGGQHDPGQMRTAAAVLRRLRESLEQDERGRDP